MKREDAQKFKLGSGFVHLYGIEKSYHQFGQYDGRDKHRVSYVRAKFIPDKMTFGEEQYRPGRSDRHCDVLSRCVYYPPVKAHVVRVEQPTSLSEAWKKFVLRDAHGFTQHGVERLNDSIRTYVYCILGAQARTRTAIVGSGGKSFDAQREFQNLTSTSVDSSFNIGDSIKRYQDVLQHARSAVNYSFGYSLYMAPSDMLLHIGDSITGYNKNKVAMVESTATGCLPMGATLSVERNYIYTAALNVVNEKWLD